MITLLTWIVLPLTLFSPQDSTVGRSGPPWSEYLAFVQAEGILFRWRVDPYFEQPGKYFFQFEFENQADHPIHFNYLIETELGERRVGAIKLAPHKTRLSGWYFEGKSVTDVEVLDSESLRKRMTEIGDQ
ncbi:MAG TPA: hypothetical protein VI932_09520 [Bacteroidota bacterium]|nr:hypothetical protein [Bacteroidota bacterium]